ncbi:MAG: isochorismatase family protein [Bacilli bacterium]|nr:isochorismatase family protein [Bacilli bacterium]
MRNLKCYKRMLLSIDTVKGFILKGALHDETIAKIIPCQVALLEDAVEDQECLVVLIGEGHTLQSIEFKRFNDEPHGLLGDEESEFVDEFQPFLDRDNVLIFRKNSTSFMFAPGFIPMLDACVNLKRVDVNGCCTDICVSNGVLPMANYFDEYNRDVDIYVHERGVETYHTDVHDRDTYSGAAKLLMKQQGIHFI